MTGRARGHFVLSRELLDRDDEHTITRGQYRPDVKPLPAPARKTAPTITPLRDPLGVWGELAQIYELLDGDVDALAVVGQLVQDFGASSAVLLFLATAVGPDTTPHR